LQDSDSEETIDLGEEGIEEKQKLDGLQKMFIDAFEKITAQRAILANLKKRKMYTM
jgi:hypothetical protein